MTTGTALIPQDKLAAYVEKSTALGLKYLKEIDDETLLPLYVLDTAVLKEKARQFKAAFFDALPNVEYFYAIKSNHHPDMAHLLSRNGFGLDVSSGLELELALSVGATKIVFSGPGKTEEELMLAVSNSGKVTVLMDSFGELKRLQAVASGEEKRIRAGVRLGTNNGWGKFGIGLGRLGEFFDTALECPNVSLRGIQFHTSWNLSPDAQVSFIRRLASVLSALSAEHRGSIEFIDVGGGYWPPEGEWMQPAATPEGKLAELNGQPIVGPLVHHYAPAVGIQDYALALARAVQENIMPLMDVKICLEPGRWISNDSMHLLIRVIDVKDENTVITDAGTNAVGWDRFESDYCPVINLSRPSLKENPCNVYGSLCTPHDVWGYSYFGEGIKEGDVLMVPSQGAYTYSLRQGFIKPLPDVFVI